MKHSLYYKFILGYLIFGLLGFCAVATVASELTYEQLIKEEAQTLYDEASLLASSYSQVYKGRNLNIASAYPQMEADKTKKSLDALRAKQNTKAQTEKQ